MKKLLALALSVLSIGFVASTAEAKSTEPSAKNITVSAVEPQIRVRIGNNRRRNRRVYRTTRISPNGRRVVTKTYRSNGRRVVVRKRVYRRY